jgi:hypothetical protein
MMTLPSVGAAIVLIKVRKAKGIASDQYVMSAASTPLHKIPDINYVKHRLVKNTLPSHHVKHHDTRVQPKCRRAEQQAASRHPV